MTREEVAAIFPAAAAWASVLREVFGQDTRLTWARNHLGGELGRRTAGLTVRASLFATLEREYKRLAGVKERDAWVPTWQFDRRTRLAPNERTAELDELGDRRAQFSSNPATATAARTSPGAPAP